MTTPPKISQAEADQIKRRSDQFDAWVLAKLQRRWPKPDRGQTQIMGMGLLRVGVGLLLAAGGTPEGIGKAFAIVLNRTAPRAGGGARDQTIGTTIPQ